MKINEYKASITYGCYLLLQPLERRRLLPERVAPLESQRGFEKSFEQMLTGFVAFDTFICSLTRDVL
jgi:hypothetical protein